MGDVHLHLLEHQLPSESFSERIEVGEFDTTSRFVTSHLDGIPNNMER